MRTLLFCTKRTLQHVHYFVIITKRILRLSWEGSEYAGINVHHCSDIQQHGKILLKTSDKSGEALCL